MTTQHAVEKLANAIKLTTITWENGTVLQGEFVTIRRRDAIALMQLLTKEDKERTGALSNTPAAAVAV